MPSVRDPISFEADIAVEKLKRYKLPLTYQFGPELIRVGGNTLHSVIHRAIYYFWLKL